MFHHHTLNRLCSPSGLAIFVGCAILFVGTGDRVYGQVWNTALGGAFSPANVNPEGALTSLQPGAEKNSGFGANAGASVSTGDNINAFGYNALLSNTTADANNAFGSQALEANALGAGNNAFGFRALQNNGAASGADDNNAFGNSALTDNTTGASNSAFGESAMRLNASGSENVAVGMNSLRQHTSGEGNVGVGYEALTANTAGNGNTAIGHQANNTVASVLQSTALGASTTASGDSSTAVGFRSNASFARSTAIGHTATTTRDDQMALGTTTSTYTMPGVGSAASRAAQSGPTEFVTADAQGNLSTDGGATKIIIDKNTHGIAGAFAISGIPEVLPNGTNYAVSANWGTFGGANAAALGGVARVDGDLFFNAATVLGYAPGVRAGLTYCW